MEKWGFGLSRLEVINLVAEYVKQNDIQTPFKNGIPGEDWFLNFKKRQGLSIKKTQSVEYARKKSINPYTVYEYFNLLCKTLDQLELHDKPSQVWNLDETSFCLDPSKTKVVGANENLLTNNNETVKSPNINLQTDPKESSVISMDQPGPSSRSNPEIENENTFQTTLSSNTSFKQLLLQTCKQAKPVDGPLKRKRVSVGAEVITAN